MKGQVRGTNSQDELKRLVVTYDEFGKLFGCSRSHVNKLVKGGVIPVVPLGGKRLIARKVVDQLLQGHTVVSEPTEVVSNVPDALDTDDNTDDTDNTADTAAPKTIETSQDLADAIAWTVNTTWDLRTQGA